MIDLTVCFVRTPVLVAAGHIIVLVHGWCCSPATCVLHHDRWGAIPCKHQQMHDVFVQKASCTSAEPSGSCTTTAAPSSPAHCSWKLRLLAAHHLVTSDTGRHGGEQLQQLKPQHHSNNQIHSHMHLPEQHKLPYHSACCCA